MNTQPGNELVKEQEYTAHLKKQKDDSELQENIQY